MFSSLSAQSWEDLTLRAYKGDYFELADSLEHDNNYLLITTAEWCGWCKRALIEWTTCYEEWTCAYDLEIIALCSDGFTDQQQRFMHNFFEDNGIPFKVWYTSHASLSNAFEFRGYPTTFMFRNGPDHFGKIAGYRNCVVLNDSIISSFSEYYTLSNDLDNDGSLSCHDCDDQDPDRSPDKIEIPFNGIDDDCNEETLDNDGDQDGYSVDVDCNDEDPEIHPGHLELCNLYDDNCNGEIDEGYDTNICYIDEDADGYGSSLWWDEFCTLPPSYSYNSRDCDDNDPNINPSAEEIPNNGIDEDCNGEDLIVSSINQEEMQSINIYPTPVDDILYIDLPYDMDGYLNIYSSIGERKIHSHIVPKIDLSLLNSGVYLLELVIEGNGHRLSKRIYVQ